MSCYFGPILIPPHPSQISGPLKYVTHLRPQFLVVGLLAICLSSQRFYVEGFVWGAFCLPPCVRTQPLQHKAKHLQFYVSYVRKKFKSVMSHPIGPSPCHLLLSPPPLECDVLYGRPPIPRLKTTTSTYTDVFINPT